MVMGRGRGGAGGGEEGQRLPPLPQAKVVFDSCMRGSERVLAEASLLGALPLTDACQTGTHFADVPIPTVVPMAHSRGGEAEYAASLYEHVGRMMDEYWSLLPVYAPYRQRYHGLNAATLHADMVTFLQSLGGGNGSGMLLGRGNGAVACVGC